MGGAVEQSSVFHLRGDRVSAKVLKQREDLLGTTSSSSLVYASLDGWRRHMVEQGRDLLDTALRRAHRVRDAVAALPGLRVLGDEVVAPGASADLDVLKVVVDVRELGITGMQAAEWLRAECHVDCGASDTCRIVGQFTHADDDGTENLFVDSLRVLTEKAHTIEPRPEVWMPAPESFELEQAVLPRRAYFGPTEQVPARKAAGRIAAEVLSPYPPGVPVVAPGEVVTEEVVHYLRSGVRAGMLVPDAADPSLETLRVMAKGQA